MFCNAFLRGSILRYITGNILTYDIKGEPFKANKNNNLSVLCYVVALGLFLIPKMKERLFEFPFE